MKKFLLSSLFVFGFAMLSAVPATSPLLDRYVSFQDARNYCSDIGMRLATRSQLEALCGNKNIRGEFWTLEGTAFYLATCKEMPRPKTAKALCSR